MYKSSYIPVFNDSLPVNDSGNVQTRVVVVTSGDYDRNSFGFIRSDFAMLAASQDAMSLQKALSKMQEFAATEVDNSDKSFEEICQQIIPRFVQSPAELDRFELYCIDNALDTYAKLKKLDDEQKVAIAKAKQEEIARLRSELSLPAKDAPAEPVKE